MSVAKQQAENFLNACRASGFSFQIKSDSVLSIRKDFTPGDHTAFSYADMDAYGVLATAPLKGGSVWGTEGSNIGGAVGLKNGYYVLNKSGSGTRFMNALRKLGDI